jgi:hypothetical protein
MKRLILALLAALPLVATPANWVPARWPWTDAQSLALLDKSSVNCLLVDAAAGNISVLAAAAAPRNISVLAVLRPGAEVMSAARGAVRARAAGIVLEGDFPEGTGSRVADALADTKTPVIELTSRNRMSLTGNAPVIGTYQGVWAGVQVTDDGKAKAAPSGSAWIDTNSGFLRTARAFGHMVWIGNLPPDKTVITPERYQQAIGDAEMVGAHWVLAFDGDLSAKLQRRDPVALQTWQRMNQTLNFFVAHAEWRDMLPAGKLAVVQGKEDGALLSGGVLDMIAVKHTPVRAVPPGHVDTAMLRGATMAVNVDPASLTPAERDVLKTFTRSGGTLLTAPPGWRDANPANRDRITLDEKELKRLDDIWHDVQSMIGRKNLGVRLFNVSSMLSNLLSSSDGKSVTVQLVNYADYPVENVTVHVLGKFHHARLLMPDAAPKDLEVYENEDGSGVDIDLVKTCAAVQLD